MAFNRNYLNTISSGKNNRANTLYSYHNPYDTLATISADDYFNNFNEFLVNDIIFCMGSDSRDLRRIVTISPNVTTAPYLPNVDDLWKRVGTTLYPEYAGDDVDLGSAKITTTYTPVNNEDLANKLYVDSQVAGIDTFKELKDVTWKGNPNSLFRVDATGLIYDESTYQINDGSGPNDINISRGSTTLNVIANATIGDTFTTNATVSITSPFTVSSTVTLDQDLATAQSPTWSGLTLSSLNTANGIVQTDGSGVLSTSTDLPDGTTATTQPAGTSNTTIATTAYADTQINFKQHKNLLTATDFNLNPNIKYGQSSVTFSNSDWFADQHELVIENMTTGSVERTYVNVASIPATTDRQTITAVRLVPATQFTFNGTGKERLYVRMPIEGYDFTHIYNQTFNFSVTMRANPAGIYTICFFLHQVNLTNTFQNFSFNVPVTTYYSNGVWEFDDALGLEVDIVLNAGAFFINGDLDSWRPQDSLMSNLQTVDWGKDAGWATHYIEWYDAQVEVGTVQSAFEILTVEEVLTKCLRYNKSSYNSGVRIGTITDVGCSVASATAGTTYDAVPLARYFDIPLRNTGTTTFFSTNSGVINRVYDTVNNKDITITSVNDEGVNSTGWPLLNAAPGGLLPTLLKAHFYIQAQI